MGQVETLGSQERSASIPGERLGFRSSGNSGENRRKKENFSLPFSLSLRPLISGASKERETDTNGFSSSGRGFIEVQIDVCRERRVKMYIRPLDTYFEKGHRE